MLRRAVEEGGVVRLCLSQPPENALTPNLARALADQLTDIDADPNLTGIILHSDGPVFATGPDLSAMDLSAEHAALAALNAVIEGCATPIVAVVDGLAHGAGLELALAANARVTGPRARLAHSHLKLGLLPIMGAAQRLTRLAGPAVALELLRVGQPISGAEAARLGLIDRHLDDVDPLAAAGAMLRDPQGFAAMLLPASERHDKLTKPGAFQATIRHYRQQKLPVVTSRLVDCVEAAQLLPFDSGLEYEAAAFLECQSDDRSCALRHIVGAEARVAPAATPSADQPRIARLAVLGASNGAARWSVAALTAGLSVAHLASGDPITDRAVAESVRQALSADPGGKPDEVARNARMLRFQSGAHTDAAADADMVLVTDPALVPDAAAAMAPGRVLALAVSGDAEPSWPVRQDLRTLGLRSAGTAAGARLVELVLPEGTPAGFADAMAQFMRRLGRVPILAPAGEGGVASAIWGACVLAAREMVRLGADPAVIDAALKARGFASLPFGGKQTPLGRPLRLMSETEVLTRCFDAMANAGALLVQAGVARRPSDIDLAMVHGYGVPRDLGGPMFAADRLGLLKLRNRIRARQGEEPEFWAPAPLLQDLIKNGRSFADLDRGRA